MRTSLVSLHEDGLSVHAGHGQRRRYGRAYAGKVVVEAAQVHRLHPQIRLQAPKLRSCVARLHGLSLAYLQQCFGAHWRVWSSTCHK